MRNTVRQIFLLHFLTQWGRFDVVTILFLLAVLLTGLSQAPAESGANYHNTKVTEEREPDPVDRLIKQALLLRGTPYVYGGKTPEGFDCSGYARYVYRQVGITLPGSSRAQFKVGTPINLEDAQRGDLVFFSIYGNRINHVGILLDTVSGSTPFVHATSRRGVRIDKLEDAYYASRLVGARTVSLE